MEKIKFFQITGMTISGFKSYQEPTELTFGNPTIITGGNGRGKTSVADAIAFAVTGLPFFGEPAGPMSWSAPGRKAVCASPTTAARSASWT